MKETTIQKKKKKSQQFERNLLDCNQYHPLSRSLSSKYTKKFHFTHKHVQRIPISKTR